MSAGDGTPRPGGSRRRAAILEGAIEVFAELGYAGASLRELAAGAGVQKGHLAYYFPTKDDLLYELVDDLHERFVRGLAVWCREIPEPTAESLLNIFRQHLGLVFERRLQTRVAYDNLRFLTSERRDAIIAKRDRYEHQLGRKIGACRSAGVPVVDAPGTIITKTALAVLNWPYQWYAPSGRYTREELQRQLAERALAAIQPLDPGSGLP